MALALAMVKITALREPYAFLNVTRVIRTAHARATAQISAVPGDLPVLSIVTLVTQTAHVPAMAMTTAVRAPHV